MDIRIPAKNPRSPVEQHSVFSVQADVHRKRKIDNLPRQIVFKGFGFVLHGVGTGLTVAVAECRIIVIDFVWINCKGV